MRQCTRHVKQAIAGTMILLALMVSFQNCAPMYVAGTGDNPLYDEDEILGCIGDTCERNLKATRVYLASATATVYRSGLASTSFDVGGYCDTAGYPGSRFYTQMFDGSTPVEATEKATGVKCDELGRFRLLVALPAGYDYNKGYTLKIRMAVIDENGKELDNPTNLTRQQVSIPNAPE